MIVMVCGPPGAGKTTLAVGLERRLEERGYAFETLHSDDYDRRTYDRLYAEVAERIESDGERPGDETPSDDTSGFVDGWILDGTFFRRAWRNRFYRLDDTYEVWVKASLETCLERNRERGAPIPEQGVRAIYGAFEPPRADLEIDAEELDVETALDRLEVAVLDWLE